MSAGKMHANEVETDITLVRRLPCFADVPAGLTLDRIVNEVVDRTRQTYLEAYRRLTGLTWA